MAEETAGPGWCTRLSIPHVEIKERVVGGTIGGAEIFLH
jgi:hypothetical protein